MYSKTRQQMDVYGFIRPLGGRNLCLPARTDTITHNNRTTGANRRQSPRPAKVKGPR